MNGDPDPDTQSSVDDDKAVADVRDRLLASVRKLFEEKGWTSAEMAEKRGVAKERLDAVLRGSYERFDLEESVGLVGKLDLNLNVEITRRD